jgi:hypothetical protein
MRFCVTTATTPGCKGSAVTVGSMPGATSDSVTVGPTEVTGGVASGEGVAGIVGLEDAVAPPSRATNGAGVGDAVTDKVAAGPEVRRDAGEEARLPPGMDAMQVAEPTRTTAIPVRTLKNCFRLATAQSL